ncbi:MAG: hypothetical protein R3E79_14880 [Caldilineaceae bacterium]
MSKQTVSLDKIATQQQAKPQSTIDPVVEMTEFAGEPLPINERSVKVSLLYNSRFPAIQRQMLLLTIGQQLGNNHLRKHLTLVKNNRFLPSNPTVPSAISTVQRKCNCGNSIQQEELCAVCNKKMNIQRMTASDDRKEKSHILTNLPIHSLTMRSERQVLSNRPKYSVIQCYRTKLPRPIPVCGHNLTHVDIEPPRWRDLEPCLPAGVPVYRMNIVGRQVSSATTGRGKQIFNLHIGYYRDPRTGRFCGIADDSKLCLAGRCVNLGCFPTPQEVLDAIIDFLKGVLRILGIILLAILALILAWLLKGMRGPMPAPTPVLASTKGNGSHSEQGSEAFV